MNQDPATNTGAVAGAQADSNQAGSGPTAGRRPRTQKEIAAAFAIAFADVIPAGPVPLAQRLEPYRKQVLKLRAAGLSWKRIAAGMRRPPILERVSGEALMKVFGGAAGTAGAAAAAAAGPGTQDPRQ
jgi:hypothetical protein